MTWEKLAKELDPENGILFHSKESVVAGEAITFTVSCNTLVLSYPVFMLVRPPGKGNESVDYRGTTPALWKLDRADNRKVCRLQSREWIWDLGIWFSECEITRPCSQLCLALFFLGTEEILTRGKTWPELWLWRLVMTRLQELDHPYALTMEVPAKTVYTRHGVLQGPWNWVAMEISALGVYQCVRWKVKSEWL